MTRVGFIGTGNFARQHAEILQELGIEIVGCYGTNSKKTDEFSRDFKCKIYSYSAQLISSEIIDALYIVIPPFAHDGKLEFEAVKKKIPFLCEKPVGLNLLNCEQIVQQIKKNNLITSSGYFLRYDPIFSQISEIINQNKISTMRVCSYTYMPKVHWWRKTSSSGGIMVEAGSHYIDLLRYLFGDIDSVASVTSEGIANNAIIDCEMYDSMEAVLKFKSGVIGSIGMTHLLNKIDARNDTLEIYGQDFALKIDLFKLRYQNEATLLYKLPNDKNWNSVSHFTCKKDLLTRESSAFLSAIQKKDPSLILSDYPDAVKSLAVVLAMNRSSNSKQFAIV